MPTLIVAREEPIAVVQLNRPQVGLSEALAIVRDVKRAQEQSTGE